VELFARAIREADDVAELGRLRAIVAEVYADDDGARDDLVREIEVRAGVLVERLQQLAK
jgi:hypothetical protein